MLHPYVHIRTRKHNLTLASLFSMVAGMVNVTGFLSIHTLTTHVTGHVAFLAEAILLHNQDRSINLLLYIFFFWFGAFVSGLLVAAVGPRSERYVYLFPILLESVLLAAVGLSSFLFNAFYPSVITFLLLFAMGLQNATVTQLSNALIRTTHLTGLFTDLAVELAQLLFYKAPSSREQLKSQVQLRVQIVTSFLIGGLLGGLAHSISGIHTLLFPSLLLMIVLAYDYLKFSILRRMKKVRVGSK